MKNGTLGTVEQESWESTKVRLDNGRSVPLDFKDYGHVDHGSSPVAQGTIVVVNSEIQSIVPTI